MQKDREGSQPTLKLCDVERPSSGSCGFHLSRTAWDPYPWVSRVEAGSAAEAAGLQPGDCVLEVNGEDVLGQRIGEVASRVKARDDSVTLLLWNASSDPRTATTCITGNVPSPESLERLSNCLKSVLQLLECPVCLETIPPPAFQCCNGHILCGGCRARADKCPVCRVGLGPRGRCLLADKLHNLVTTTVNRYNQSKQTINKKNTSISYKKHQPHLYLKSRIISEIKEDKPISEENGVNECTNMNETTVSQHALKSKTRIILLPQISIDNDSIQQSSEMICDQSNFAGNQDSQITFPQNNSYSKSTSLSQTVSGGGNTKPIKCLKESKASSIENISSCNSKSSPKKLSEQIFVRSLSAGQIPINNRSPTESQNLEEKVSCNELDELLLHCPYPMRSEQYCQNVSYGPQGLLQHLLDVHEGPFVQYFLRASSNGVTLRLPLSNSKTALSSLMSFTTPENDIFFLGIAAGATQGNRLIWFWLMGDAVQAERYRLKLTLPEGDTHTGPVFSLTTSWSNVVNSNCSLSIEEQRYKNGNPEVKLEILDVLKTN